MSEIQKAKELSVLMPPPPSEGGLIRMPKKNPSVDDHQFKVPSLIGNLFKKKNIWKKFTRKNNKRKLFSYSDFNFFLSN